MMRNRDELSQAVRAMSNSGVSLFSSGEFAAALQVSLATAKRYLDAMTKTGELVREGAARSTRYRIAVSVNHNVMRERDAPLYVTAS